MKKIFTLAAAMLVSVSMWALTEIVPKADNNWEGNSVTITNQECVNGNTGDYAKFRTSMNGNTLTLNIKEGITVTGISIKAYSNNTGATISLSGVSIDGTPVNPFMPVVFPVLSEKENAPTYVKDGLTAIQSVVFEFDNSAIDGSVGKKNKQIMAIVTITYTTPTYIATYVANYEGSKDSIEAEAIKVNDNVFKNPAGKYFTGWNDKADGTGNEVAVGAKVTQDTVLYAQWKEFKECLRLTVAAQGEEPAKDAEVVLRLGSNTGGKIYFADAKNAFKDDYLYKPAGLQLGGGGKDSLRVVLDKALAAGAILRLTLVAVNDGKPAINIVSGGKKINLATNVDYFHGDTTEIYYKVVAGDGLAGAKVFNLQRSYGTVILRSLSAQQADDCTPIATPYSEDTSLKYLTLNGDTVKAENNVYYYKVSYKAIDVKVKYEMNAPGATSNKELEFAILIPNEEENTISDKIIVFAEDGTAIEYTINISREAKPTYSFSATWNELYGNVATVPNGTYKEGTVIQLTVSSNDGYHFVKWSDGITDNPRTIELTKDTFFTAIFEEDKCLTASGTCGDSATWELSCDGVLTISGSGAMYPSINSSANVPWNSYRDKITSVVISEGITSIGTFAFYYCQYLKSVTIPTSVTSIGSSAFEMCGILSIQIPNSVTKIDYNAFNKCFLLTSLKIGDEVLKEGDKGLTLQGGCFSNCNELVSVTLGNNVMSIGGNAFTNCTKLTEITIPVSTTQIIGSAFYGCSNLASINVVPSNPNFCSIDGVVYTKDTTKVIICPQTRSGVYILPQTVTCIGAYAFQGCNQLSEVVIPNGLTSIEYTAFSSCHNLSSMTIPSSVITIGSSAFSECGFDSIVIPNSVKQIDSYAFSGCGSLRYLFIGDSVQTIGTRGFESCYNLSSIYCSAITPPVLGWDSKYNVGVFYSVDKSIPLYVPASSIDTYKSADQWKDFTNILPIPGTEIPCGADTRMPAPEYTFKHIVEKCTSSLQFTNTSHVITRYNGEEVHTIEPCTDVHWSFRRLLGSKIMESSEMNPTCPCIPEGDTIEVTFTSYLDAGMCDSARIDTFVVPNIIPVNSEYHTSICAGDSILFDGKWFNEDTVYTAHYTSLAGCDSTSTLFLTVYPSYEFITDTTVYVGDEVMWHNGYIKPEKAGTYHYVDTLKTYFGCDSVFVLNLDVKPRSQKMCSWLVESSDLEMGVVTTDFTEPFYKYGTQITVKASPNSGYKFVKWNDGKKYNPYKFSLLDDKYLLAIFMAEDEEQDSTTVSPSSTSATFTWPFIVGGFSYSLTIYLDFACTIPFCTISFDKDGRLVGISFGKKSPRRMLQDAGFTYTVSDLNANTTYYYKMETKDEDNKLINTDEGMFKTTNDATGLDPLTANPSPLTVKILRDGQILILRGDKVYTLTGQEVR